MGQKILTPWICEIISTCALFSMPCQPDLSFLAGSNDLANSILDLQQSTYEHLVF